MAQFLSDEWMAAARQIYAEHEGEPSASAQDVQINLVVKGAPFGDGTIQAHLNTTGGDSELALGHIDGAPTTVTTDYDTARSLFLELDQQAALAAFMAGKIQFTGDMTKIMLMMSDKPDEVAIDIAQRIRDITD